MPKPAKTSKAPKNVAPTPAQLEARRKLLGMTLPTNTRKNSPASPNNSGNAGNKGANAGTQKAKPLSKQERAAAAARAKVAANEAAAQAKRAANQATVAAAAPAIQEKANAAIAENKAARNAAKAGAAQREKMKKHYGKKARAAIDQRNKNAEDPHSLQARSLRLAKTAGNIT